MAKNRYIGRSGKISIDVTGAGTSFSQVTVARNIQPPGQTKSRIDVTGMDDDRAHSKPGIEEESEWSFEVQWDSDDTVDASIRTAYSNDTLCNFKAEFTDGTNTYAVEWDGYITDLTPTAVDGSSTVAMQVSGVRDSDISETVS